MDSKNRVYKTIMLVVLTAFVTFMITIFSVYSYFMDKETVSNDETVGSIDVESDENLQEYLKKIKSTISKYYLWNDNINEEKLEEGAVQGYVAALGDEYTEYIPAEEMKEYKEDIVGNFVGIGIYMIADEESGKIIVYYPIPDSPAEKAGIKAGDTIESVDGKEYTANDFETIADNIKGEEGTKVKIGIDRNGEKLSFEIERKKINTNPITIKIVENNIGYLKLPSFDEGTAEDFKATVEELKSKGA